MLFRNAGEKLQLCHVHVTSTCEARGHVSVLVGDVGQGKVPFFCMNLLFDKFVATSAMLVCNPAFVHVPRFGLAFYWTLWLGRRSMKSFVHVFFQCPTLDRFRNLGAIPEYKRHEQITMSERGLHAAPATSI